jgi:hypothetical protein
MWATHALPVALIAKASDAHFAFDLLTSSFVFVCVPLHKSYVRRSAKCLWQETLVAWISLVAS